MKKIAITLYTFILIVVLVISLVLVVHADKPTSFDSQGNETGWDTSNSNCNRIQDGNMTYSDGHYLYDQPMQVGYDPYGYNYQAHMFKGSYFNVYSGGAGFPPWDGDDSAYLAENSTAENHWAWPYRAINLLMKWNDAWISNTDCDGDNRLDRHYGLPSYIGSGAWETNHQWGSYEEGGKTYTWNYFCKIVAVPADANLTDGIWYTADGSEIGPTIWNEFAIIEEVINDPSTGDHGAAYISPHNCGFGSYAP